MPFLDFILWDVRPEIFWTVRWYGLLFATGFLTGQYIMSRIFKIEGKSENDLEKLMLYMVAATILGARLGHCFFYEPAYFLANPLEILYVWKGGLASHGAAVGILLALWLYSRKRADQSFWWVVDRIVIVVALGGAFIRFGNLMNSEIIGKPSNMTTAFIFAHSLNDAIGIEESETILRKTLRQGDKDTTIKGQVYQQLELKVFFNQETNEEEITAYMANTLPFRIKQHYEANKHFRVFTPSLDHSVAKQGGEYVATASIWGIPRHPAQLYESISSFLIFLLLLWAYSRRKGKTPEGQLFGIFMVLLFTLRFLYEFLKENQVDFEDNLSLNMGQILSIPAVLIGLFALYISFQNARKTPSDKLK